jgi:hypothetical protein
MAFTEKALAFTFSGAQSGNFSASGLRAYANIQSFPDRAGSTAQVKIWGLTLDQMNNFSSTSGVGVAAQNFNLVIEAGDLGGTLAQVINGPILRSFPDLTGAPESVFNVTLVDTFGASSPIGPQSLPGAQSAESLIASLCTQATPPLTFNNSAGASAVVRNMSTYGSAIDQIARIATAAKFNWKTVGTTLFIWPQGGTVDDVVINLGPNTDPEMVSYPGYWEMGLIATSLFNPEIQIGRQMNLTSSIPKANGKFQIIQVQHELTTMIAKGPWFTTALLVGTDQ